MLTRTTLLTHDPFPAWMPDGAMPILYRYGIGEVRLGEMTVGDDGDAVGPPVLAADAQGGLHAAWVRLGTPFCVEYRYSADGGQRWDEVQVLSDAETAPGGYDLNLAAGANGGIHLVWTGDGVFHRRWTADSGWGAATVVSQRGLDSGSLALALDDDGLAHLAWLNWDGLYEVHQSPGGAWTTPVERVDLLHETGINAGLAVSADGARHLVWGVKENEQNVLYYGVLSNAAE